MSWKTSEINNSERLILKETGSSTVNQIVNNSNIRSGISGSDGGGGGDNTFSLVNSLKRGIYLRPTVFMINGTATQLMESFDSINTTASSNIKFSSYASSFPSPSPSPSGATATSMTVTQPVWWEYRRSDATTFWVSFNYELRKVNTEYLRPDVETQAILFAKKCTEDELVQDSQLTKQGNTADAVQYQVIGNQLSISLRENRLSAPLRCECFGIMDEPVEVNRISTFLGAIGEYLAYSSGLISGVEVALRAMQPGKTSEFLIADPCMEFENIDNVYKMGSTIPFSWRCFYIKIELLHRISHEPILPHIFQKYVVHRPPYTMEDNMKTKNISRDRTSVHTRLFRFFSPTLFSKSTDVTLPHSLMSIQALRALFTAIISAAGNCHAGNPSSLAPLRDGRPSGILARLHDVIGNPLKGVCTDAGNVKGASNDHHRSSTDGNPPLTDEYAKMFVSLNFLTSPSDGATVSCRIIRNSLLTGNKLPPIALKDVLLGGMAIPLWLDMLLQTMRTGEEDVVNICMNSESDLEFHCSLMNELQNIVHQHVDEMVSLQPSYSSGRCEEDDDDNNNDHSHHGEEKQQEQPRVIPSASANENLNLLDNTNVSFVDRLKSEGEHNSLLSDNFSCHVVLEDFKNAYDINSFFFVDPKSSLLAVEQLEKEVRALCRVESVWCKYDDCSNNDFITDKNELPACVTANRINIQPTSFGHIRQGLDERGIIKAIHKLNFTVFLLTFYVNEESLMAREMLTSEMSQKRRIALARYFYFLGVLYSRLECKSAYMCALDAYSAAIEIYPNDEQAWVGRGKLVFGIHQESALDDFRVALRCVQIKLQRLALPSSYSSTSNSFGFAEGTGSGGGVNDGSGVPPTHDCTGSAGGYGVDREEEEERLRELWNVLNGYIAHLENR
ncbi:hypothetical protein LSM04_005350 [Trypanosoma melophagium]|uniref:uncharacterized protein n=1 Tax=Trypanosoma melophagium TaxID=715481 RepID=UPI00351A62D5|nr:hypothetical protein LSM04_005350 [Trypanosoma melophagium]